MNYKRFLLEKLVEKYRRSKHARDTALINRRISFMFTRRDFPEYFDEGMASKREDIHEVSKNLQFEGLISIQWLEPNDSITAIHLTLERINDIYSYLGETPYKDQILILEAKFQSVNNEVAIPWIRSFVEDALSKLEQKKIPNGFGNEMDELLFLTIKALQDKGEEEMPERLFSKKYLGGSKLFENFVRTRLIHVYKKFGPMKELLDDDSILGEMGIARESYELSVCGAMTLMFSNYTFDLSNLPYGTSLNAASLIEANIEKINAKEIRLIENKTVYYESIKKRDPNVLYMYLGGFPGPGKRKFLKKLNEMNHNLPNLRIMFWGDIDLGGFRIFTHLKNHVFPNLSPFMMDKDTLINYEMYTENFSEAYAEKLYKITKKENFAVFWPVLDYMLDKKIKLEQEAIII